MLSPRVTLNDIAADSGVSRATVSLVLRNVPTVAPQTRTRVRRSMQRLGYVYHRGAAGLRTQRSRAIGLVVSDITNPFFAEVAVAIEDRLGLAGYVTLLGNTSENAAKQERVLRSMQEYPADGILICPRIEDPGSWNSPAASRAPIVAYARFVPGFDYVGVDNTLGAEIATDHLFKIGHKRIAFIGGSPELSSSRERVDGYINAHSRSGRKYDRRLIVQGVPNRGGGHEGLLRALKVSPPPTGAICFNDVVAFGVLQALQLLGRRPGYDFGVVGFNNIPDAALSRPGLTTVDTAPAKLGEAAADLLLQRIENRSAPIRRIILQPKLIVRESCGGCRSDVAAFDRGTAYEPTN
ncbi:MAG: LacI family DNA-binding transcriptional regulator [Chthoniobacterales bacterium]